MGEAGYCMRVPETWCGELYTHGYAAGDILDQAFMSIGVESVYHDMELAHCYLFDSVESADLCQRPIPPACRGGGDVPACCDEFTGPVCPPGAYKEDLTEPGSYPYAGIGSYQIWKFAQEWRQFDTAADILGEDVHPVQMVGVRTRQVGVVTDLGAVCPSIWGVAGAAYSAFNPFDGASSLSAHGAMGYTLGSQGEAGIGTIAAHELGHTMGLQHDSETTSFMYSTDGGTQPTLGLIDASATPEDTWMFLEIAGHTELVGADEVGMPCTQNFECESDSCVDGACVAFHRPSNVKVGQNISTSKNQFPRPTGFAYTGCDSDAECRPLGRDGACSESAQRCDIF